VNVHVTWLIDGSTYRERTGRVTGCCPAPATVQTEALVGDDPEQSAATESLGVGLALDLENVERQQDNLTDTNQGTGGCVHDGLAIALAECLVESVAVVPGEVVASERLSTVLVDALEDLRIAVSPSLISVNRTASYLVGSGVTEAREEREESAGNRSIGSVSEDDLVQVRSRLDLADVAHETLGCGVDRVEDHELSKTRTSYSQSDDSKGSERTARTCTQEACCVRLPLVILGRGAGCYRHGRHCERNERQCN
jgi:hypothetical protein